MAHFGIYAEALSAIVLTLALLLRMQRGSGNEGDQGVTATRGNTKLGALRSQTAISPNIVPPQSVCSRWKQPQGPQRTPNLRKPEGRRRAESSAFPGTSSTPRKWSAVRPAARWSTVMRL